MALLAGPRARRVETTAFLDECGGSGKAPVTVLLDGSAASWRALQTGLLEAKRDGRPLRGIVVRHSSWVDGVGAGALPMWLGAASEVMRTAWAEMRDEFAAVFATHGFPPPCLVASRREVVEMLTRTPAHMVVAGDKLGRRMQRSAARLRTSLLLVP